MPHIPFFWLGVSGFNFGVALVGRFVGLDYNLVMFYGAIGWFALGVCGLLAKLNQVADQIENAQKLQTTAFRTLKKDK